MEVPHRKVPFHRLSRETGHFCHERMPQYWQLYTEVYIEVFHDNVQFRRWPIETGHFARRECQSTGICIQKYTSKCPNARYSFVTGLEKLDIFARRECQSTCSCIQKYVSKCLRSKYIFVAGPEKLYFFARRKCHGICIQKYTSKCPIARYSFVTGLEKLDFFFFGQEKMSQYLYTEVYIEVLHCKVQFRHWPRETGHFCQERMPKYWHLYTEEQQGGGVTTTSLAVRQNQTGHQSGSAHLPSDFQSGCQAGMNDTCVHWER